MTCPDTYAASHTILATRETGAVAAAAEEKKTTKYGELAMTHFVAPLAIETSGAFGPGAREFFTKLGRRLIRVTGSDVPMPHDPADFSCPAKRQCCRGAGHHRTM